jgi:hypothetical protein
MSQDAAHENLVKNAPQGAFVPSNRFDGTNAPLDKHRNLTITNWMGFGVAANFSAYYLSNPI